MRFALILVLGLVFAAGLGFAAHVIARDTVGLPVASIEAGDGLAPVAERRTTTGERIARSTTTTATTTATTPTESEPGDDHGRNHGRGRNRGRGSDDD